MVPTLFNRNDKNLQESIIVAPQCPAWPNQWVDTPWAEGNYSIDAVPESNELKAVVELLEQIKKTYSTDEDRYYAMGLSMGGFGVWDLIMRHPEIFAAAVPICGGADVSQAESLKYMPIYTAHGINDYDVPYAKNTVLMVQALKNAGSTSVIYKEYYAGHLIWDTVAKEPDLLDWMFSKNRSERATDDNELPIKPA